MTATDETDRLAGAPYDEVTVSDVMHPGVIVCAPESPLSYAARLMAHHRIHAVVVMGDDEEGGLWGVVSDTDVLSAFAQPELVASNAGALARTPIVTVSPSDGVARAAELMRTHRVSHLLVTVRSRPVGVVSTLDLARTMAAGVGAGNGQPGSHAIRARGVERAEPRLAHTPARPTATSLIGERAASISKVFSVSSFSYSRLSADRARGRPALPPARPRGRAPPPRRPEAARRGDAGP